MDPKILTGPKILTVCMQVQLENICIFIVYKFICSLVEIFYSNILQQTYMIIFILVLVF